MATYKLLKLKNYIYHLILGTFLVLFSLSIIQSIVSEMSGEYKDYARIAYFAGIAACLAILVFGAFMIYRAFHFDKLLMRKLSADQKALLNDELENHIQMIVKGQAIMTTHYLIVPKQIFGPYKLLNKDDIIACFRTERHQENKAINGTLRIFSRNFKSTVVTLGGKGSAMVEQEMFNRMIKSMPWIIHENYEDFLLKSKSRGMRKILVTEVDDDRAEYVQADPATYAPDDTLSLSGTSIPIIGQSVADDGEMQDKDMTKEDVVELTAETVSKDEPITQTLSQKLSSAGSVLNHFMPKSKKPELEDDHTISEMFEDVENGSEVKKKQKSDRKNKRTIKENVTEPIIEAATEPIIEPVTEPIIEAATEPIIEPVTEPIIEAATEPIIEPVTEPILAAATEAMPVKGTSKAAQHKSDKKPKASKKLTQSVNTEQDTKTVHPAKRKHTDPDATVVLTKDQQDAITSFEQLIMNSSKNRSSDKYKKS